MDRSLSRNEPSKRCPPDIQQLLLSGSCLPLITPGLHVFRLKIIDLSISCVQVLRCLLFLVPAPFLRFPLAPQESILLSISNPAAIWQTNRLMFSIMAQWHLHHSNLSLSLKSLSGESDPRVYLCPEYIQGQGKTHLILLGWEMPNPPIACTGHPLPSYHVLHHCLKP